MTAQARLEELRALLAKDAYWAQRIEESKRAGTNDAQLRALRRKGRTRLVNNAEALIEVAEVLVRIHATCEERQRSGIGWDTELHSIANQGMSALAKLGDSE